jgi:hypothetical protein
MFTSKTSTPELRPATPKFSRCLDDPRVAAGPVVAALRDEAYPVAVPFDAQTIAVVLDLVQPVRAGRNAGRSYGEAEIEGTWHGANIGGAPEKYQFCSNTAPARGSAEAANPTEGGFIGGVTKSLGHSLR